MEERAVWNEVSTDFDPDEETANFGTRHALESGDNLYEVIKRSSKAFIPFLKEILHIKQMLAPQKHLSIALFTNIVLLRW